MPRFPRPADASVPATSARSLVSASRDMGGSSVGYLFSGIVVTMIFVNFDSGATAAVLDDLERGCPMRGPHTPNPSFDPEYPCLTVVEQGILGALPYVGLCIGCPLAALLLQHYSPKLVVLLALIFEATATMVFAWVIGKYYLYAAKLLVGLSQSAICIYTPVWVDRFGPPSQKTTWIGVVQGTGAIGTMVGYGAAGYMTATGIFYQNAFRIQAFGLVLCSLCLSLVPRGQIDIAIAGAAAHLDSSPEVLHTPQTPVSHLASFAGRSATMHQGTLTGTLVSSRGTSSFLDAPPEGVWSASCELLSNRVWRSATIALCALFFIVTGVQYWSSKYFIVSFGQPKVRVNTIFVCIAGSAPAIGIVAGGLIVDRLGGYATPRGAERTAMLTAIWGFIATVAGVAAGSIHPSASEGRFIAVVSCIWILLLFGAMMLPPSTGLLLRSVDEDLAVFANSFSTLLYNGLGYGLGSYLPGQVADFFSDRGEKVAMYYAMMVILFWTVLGMLGMLDVYYCLRRLRQVQLLDRACPDASLQQPTSTLSIISSAEISGPESR